MIVSSCECVPNDDCDADQSASCKDARMRRITQVRFTPEACEHPERNEASFAECSRRMRLCQRSPRLLRLRSANGCAAPLSMLRYFLPQRKTKLCPITTT